MMDAFSSSVYAVLVENSIFLTTLLVYVAYRTHTVQLDFWYMYIVAIPYRKHKIRNLTSPTPAASGCSANWRAHAAWIG